MTNKIGGYGNRPVQNGTGKSVSRERDAGTSASQSAEGVLSPFLVGVNDRFGVAVRVEAVAARGQVRAELGIVVDLAVEYDPDC